MAHLEIHLIYALFIGFIGLVAFTFYQKFKKAKLAFDQLNQKHDEYNKSIQSAERIQKAVLPAKSIMDRFLEEYFIFYQPRDIVSGDFYWFEYYDCKLYVAVADCTGHGVPGAMMSLICNNALLKALYEDSSETTGELLNNTKAHVIENMSKGKFDIHDGMDISLCCIDFLEYTVEWSGANNPLWIIRNNEFIELKPDKSFIGKDLNHESFTTHNLQLAEDDLIYLFSDGYKDQFGGEKNKKFLNKRFRDLILSLSTKPLDDQHKIIRENLEKWKGNNPQVDDICVMGIKLI